MMRTSVTLLSVVALLALGSAAKAQFLVVPNGGSDTLAAFSPVDGSLLNANFMAITATTQVSAIAVGLEIWCSEQTGDRVVRYDHAGNVLGTMGPTFPGGGFDNIRGMALINGIVYVTNDGAGNGATNDSLVMFDTFGNHLGTLALSTSLSPFAVMPWQGDLLVTASSGNDDVHRYTMAGASVGVFHNSAGISFAHQISLASDGNVWCGAFTTGQILKLDATTGNIVGTPITASGARGVYELQNGNLLWSNSSGVHIYDIGLQTSSMVLAGSSYHINLIPADAAWHSKYGGGCHAFTQDNSNLLELFPTVLAADTALTGNALRFQLTANGYVADWLPGQAGALYVAPTGGATIVANLTATTTTFTPSAAIPIPGGTTATWTISSEGVLTAGSTGNQGSLSTVTLSATSSATGLAWYTWVNQNPVETGSGKIKWEEVGGVLYVTFDGVELGTGTPTLSPSTYQYQINMASGEVTMVWVSMFGVANNSASDVLVGCTLAGAGITPVSQTLSSVSAQVLAPDQSQLPLTLSASPPPVINPSTLVTYTIDNVPETAPGSGLYLSLMFLSVNPFLPGVDLTGIITSVPGCNLYLGTLDFGLGAAVTVVPQNLVQFTYSTPIFAPGNVIGAQAVALFDATFPLLNGEASGYIVSNGVLSTVNVQ